MTLHHYTRELDGLVARYHLRVERDGAGLLLANASAAVKLTPSGVIMVRRLLEGAGDEAVAEAVAREFSGADRGQIAGDVARVRQVLDELVTRSDRYPLHDLDDPDATVYRRALSAPLGADIAAGDGARVEAILDALWAAGVPQVVFAVPDEASRERAARWVERAEDLGMIAGVRGRASILGALDDLATTGVDHVDVLCAGADAESHDAVAGDGDFAALEALFAQARTLEVCAVAWVPVVAGALDTLEEVLEAAAGRGANAVILAPVATPEPDDGGAIPARELPQAAALAEEFSERLGKPVVWAPPTERDPSVDFLEQVRRGPRAAGEAFIRVEADGTVWPPSGATAAGDLLAEPWARIWAHPALAPFREASADPPRCVTCPNLSACGAGCPRDPQTWARVARAEGAR